MKIVTVVRTVERATWICFGAIFMMYLMSAVTVLADQDADDTANFGMRAIRITSLCSNGSPVIPGIPEVPPPASVADPNCPTVLPQAASPNSRWSFDISWFDPLTQKYYLADRNNQGVDIIDTRTDTVVGQATGFVGVVASPANSAGPNGVVVTNNPHQLWAGDGNGDIRVYSLDKNGLPTSNTPVRIILANETGAKHRADELAYDPDHQLILMAWDDDLDLFVAFISVSANPNNIKVVKKISLTDATGGIEQPVYDHGLGRFFVAVPSTIAHPNGELAKFNPVTLARETGIGLDGTGCFPHGLALGPRENLIVGCSADGPNGTKLNSLIVKATTGAIILTITQVGGNDEVWYNPGDNNYYLAASSNTTGGCTPPLPAGAVGGCKGGTANPVLGIVDAGRADSGPEGPQWIQNIKTVAGAHSVAAVFAVRCNGDERDDRDHGDCDRGDRDGNDIVRNRIYVPLATVPVTGTPTEPGGIGVYGRIP
jgi:hypothetical protein